MVYAKFGGQTECIMGNSKIVNSIIKFSLCVIHSAVIMVLPKKIN